MYYLITTLFYYSGDSHVGSHYISCALTGKLWIILNTACTAVLVSTSRITVQLYSYSTARSHGNVWYRYSTPHCHSCSRIGMLRSAGRQASSHWHGMAAAAGSMHESNEVLGLCLSGCNHLD